MRRTETGLEQLFRTLSRQQYIRIHSPKFTIFHRLSRHGYLRTTRAQPRLELHLGLLLESLEALRAEPRIVQRSYGRDWLQWRRLGRLGLARLTGYRSRFSGMGKYQPAQQKAKDGDRRDPYSQTEFDKILHSFLNKNR
jgi:hypothetical protein